MPNWPWLTEVLGWIMVGLGVSFIVMIITFVCLEAYWNRHIDDIEDK
jgi:hypothetical protein